MLGVPVAGMHIQPVSNAGSWRARTPSHSIVKFGIGGRREYDPLVRQLTYDLEALAMTAVIRVMVV